MNYGQFENDCLSILSFSSTRSTWVSVSSCVEKCRIPYNYVWWYIQHDDLERIATNYHFEYVVRHRHGSFYISCISKGYA